MDCQQAAEQDDLDRVKGLCNTTQDQLEAFHKALSKGSARVSAYFLAHLPRAALNESRHPLTFLLPQTLCTKYMCTYKDWAEKYCPGVDARWEQEPVWENFKDGERCCCSFGLGFVKEESWNRQQRLLKHDTHDVSLLVAAAAGGNKTFLQRLWNATAVHADCDAALAAAVSYNQTDALMFLLDNCHSSNRNLAYQGVPLVTWAAGLGFAGVVKALLKKNASTQTNSEQWDWKLFQSYTPLAAAIRFDVEGDSLPVVNELLHRSDDRKKLLKAFSRGEPPIFIAVVYGKEDLAKIMLRENADPDQATYTGERPLQKAAYQGSCGLTEVLCKHGANAEVTNPHGSTPAMIAAYSGYPEVLSILTKKCKAGLSGRDLWGNTAAHLAAKGDPKRSGKSYLQVIDMVRQGCSWCFQQRNDRGRSPLGTAVFHRRAGHVKYLVSGPFQDRMNAVYQDPVEALYWAMIPNPEICTILLEHVPSNTNVERLSNAVQKAASEGANDCLQQLHEKKAYLDSSQNGWTPLCRAAETAQPTILLYLLNQSVGWGKCSGESPLDLAASSQTWWKKDKKDWEKAKNATRLLAEHVEAADAESLVSLLAGRPGGLNSTCSIGKLHWTGLHWAVMMRNSSMLRHFVSYDNAARLKDSKGRTALSMAAALGLEDHVEILANQSDPNSKDEGGMTPIMWAARYGHANVCKRLKEMTQFQPLQKDSEGNCLMHWAASSGNQEVVDLFRHRLPFNGSKITNHRGETALFNAVRGRNPYLVEHMIQLGYNANAINAFMQTPLFVALRLCRLEVWDKLKDSTDLHRKDYLGYRIDEMPEFNSSLCLKKTSAEHYLNLQASVTSTTFTEKLESIKADNTFHKYILWTVLLSLLVTCMAKLWSQWRATRRPGTELDLVVSAMDASASESLESTESMETSTSTGGYTGRGCAHCGQNVLQVSFRAAQIQTAAKHLDQTLQWKLYARRCMDVVASVVFPTIMFRVLGWVHVLVLCVATSIFLPACFKQPGFAVREIVERPAKLFGVRDVWAQLRTVYLLLALLWRAAQSGGMWHETHRYLWDRHVYPMSDLKEISRGEFPVPFPPLNAPLLTASWPAFGIAMAAAAGSILSLMLLKRRHSNSSRPSDHKTYVAVGEDKDSHRADAMHEIIQSPDLVWNACVGAMAVFSALLLAGLWPAAPAQLPLSVGDMLVFYRFLVLMLTISWVILNLLTDHAANCDPRIPETHATLDTVAGRVYEIATQRCDEGTVTSEDAAYFQRHCQQQTCLTLLKAVVLWFFDIATDTFTIVNFAASGSYKFACLILGAGLLSFFKALFEGLFTKIVSAVRQTLKTGVRTHELQRLLELEVAFEVPVSLIMTTYGLPDVAHRPAIALMTLLSIGLSITQQATWLFQEFDVCREMDTFQIEKTPKHQSNAQLPEFFPKP